MPRLYLKALILVLVLGGCRVPLRLDNVILSYSETNTFCLGCPQFRVDFRNGGHVNYECLGGCAVPGEQHHLVPAQRFRDLVRAFHDAGFFAIPRTDPSRIVFDAPVIRLTYRDERRIHEIVDIERHIPQVTDLEKRIKTATEVERYLKPSLALYRRLVASGWNVNTLGPDHENALFSAVVSRDLDCTRFLLQNGSNVTDQTLEAASLSENVEILRLVAEAVPSRLTGEVGETLLRQAARSHRPDLVRFLLDSGVGVNARNSGPGLTALASAVDSGSLENAGLLLRKGADPDARDEGGRTALWYAAGSANTGFITLLARHGADVNARDNEGQTALMHAAERCFTWDVEALLGVGADPMIRDKRGRTVLEMQTVSAGDPKCGIVRGTIEDTVRSRSAQQP
jgi:ankyrin repeat protein